MEVKNINTIRFVCDKLKQIKSRGEKED